MKIHHAILLLCLAPILMVVLGCTQSREGLVTPSSPTSVLATSTSTPIISPTFAPTLSLDQAQAELLELLSNNSDCLLPCIWGITPGKSSYLDARAILAPLGSLSHTVNLNTPTVGDISPRYIENDLEIYTRVAFLTNLDSHIINRLTFNLEVHRPIEAGGYEDIFDSSFFGEKIGTYTLPEVLSELGIPESVLIATLGGPLTRGGKGGFDLLLLYPNQGILINYTTQMQLVDKEVYGCFANAHVEMDLHQTGESALFYESLKETDWATKMDYYKPLEEVTSMSLQEFYETYRVSTDTCIETQAKVWPVPEP